MLPTNKSAITERTIIAVVLIVILFISPVSDFWASLNAPWYSPYLAWAAAIFISWLLQRSLRNAI